MAIDLSGTTQPRHVHRVTIAVTTWTAVTLPPWAGRFTILPVTNALQLIVSATPGVTDGAAFAGTENYETVAGDARYSIPLVGDDAAPSRGGQASVFIRVASSTAVEIALEALRGG